MSFTSAGDVLISLAVRVLQHFPPTPSTKDTAAPAPKTSGEMLLPQKMCSRYSGASKGGEGGKGKGKAGRREGKEGREVSLSTLIYRAEVL